jgi:hypothetical protein
MFKYVCLCSSIILIGALPAGATVYPDECQNTYGARGYSTGLAGGESLIEPDLSTQDCCQLGEDIGKAGGRSYCVLAIMGVLDDQGDWFRPPPVNTCGFWCEYCCDQAFDYYSYWYPNDEVTPPNDWCREFVIGYPWYLIHDNFRERVCECRVP